MASLNRTDGKAVCDFCAAEEPVVEYPAGTIRLLTDVPVATIDRTIREYDLPLVVEGRLTHPTAMVDSENAWAACALCMPYIEAGDLPGLTERVLGTLQGQAPMPPWVRLGLKREILRVYGEFMQQRGAARPLRPLPEEEPT